MRVQMNERLDGSNINPLQCRDADFFRYHFRTPMPLMLSDHFGATIITTGRHGTARQGFTRLPRYKNRFTLILDCQERDTQTETFYTSLRHRNWHRDLPRSRAGFFISFYSSISLGALYATICVADDFCRN
ncbi:hypothetical protein BDQ12DRAFT_692820 [Crucibulum laeve]|uniref:Uncharacterized protein n=1 Tax=Crucibulum laeve TaxID=68775 RepID=A0A5C3LHT2_9AGAR|nr:hypothetical protein BDQ12DRAFT_692820 [Crucibulum laeve]